jgi:hypothetical protein
MSPGTTVTKAGSWFSTCPWREAHWRRRHSRLITLVRAVVYCRLCEFDIAIVTWGKSGTVVVEALSYVLEYRGFEIR